MCHRLSGARVGISVHTVSGGGPSGGSIPMAQNDKGQVITNKRKVHNSLTPEIHPKLRTGHPKQEIKRIFEKFANIRRPPRHLQYSIECY